jgi:hypothetical protein
MFDQADLLMQGVANKITKKTPGKFIAGRSSLLVDVAEVSHDASHRKS